MAVIEVALTEVHEGERAREDYDVADLVESIRQLGMLQPITVRPREAGGYELVAGGRRLRAAKELGEWLIRAEVRDADDAEALVIEAVENGLRQDFRPSEAAALGRRLERLIDTDPSVLGKLPSGERARERVARAVGMSDGTYRKARDIVSYEPRTEAGQAIIARIEAEMDATGKVDRQHRRFAGLRWCEDLVTDDLEALHHRPASLLAEVVDGDLDRLDGIEDRHRGAWVDAVRHNHLITQAPAGSGAEEPSEREEVHGAAVGSDVTSPVASEPAEHPHGFGCRACGVLVDLGSDDTEPTICPRCDGDKWYRAEYPVGPFGLINDDVVIFASVPSLTDGDAALVTCDGCDAAVFVPPATGHDLLLGACPVCAKIDWSPATINGVDVNHGGNAGSLRSVAERREEQVVAFPDFDALTGQQREALVTLWKAGEALRYSNHTTVSSIHHKVADGLAELGLVAVEVPPGGTFDDRAVTLTIDGQRVVEQFARDWWRAQSAGLNLASDWQLAGPEPHPWTRTFTVFVGRGKCRALVIGYGDTRLSPILDTRAEADAWLDSQRPAPAAVTGSEPPAPEGVNEDHGTLLEGGELAPDPSADEAEGEDSDGAVPAPHRSEDGEGEIRRSPSPSTTYVRPNEKKRPVRMAEFGRLRRVLAEAASIVSTVEATDVEPVLAHIDDVEEFIADVQGAIEALTPFLADLRLLARPPG